jgi:quercetin dioxygenase-like cupin family protein
MKVIHDDAASARLADSQMFTGRVWRTDYISAASADAISGLRFAYEPGARSFWHVHECEQAIVAVQGVGVVAWEGLEAPVLLTPGDWWHVEPGVAHWHGATPESPFVHLAVTAGGGTTWQDEVDDEDYRRTPTRVC